MSLFATMRSALVLDLACMFLCCPKLLLHSRLKLDQESPSERSSWFSAQNRWQNTPIDVASQSDTVSADVRTRRNTYLKPLLEAAREAIEPTDNPRGTITMPFPGPVLGDTTELSGPPQAVWVIARFDSFHVFAADQQYRLIYTEVNFRVTHVLRQPPSLSFAPGAVLDSEVTGGRIKKPDGKIASFRVFPEGHSYRPGGTYLLLGTYDPATQYFRLYNWWDLSSGRVVPGTLVEIDRVAKGKSKLIGLTIAGAVQYLDSALPPG